MDNKLSLKDGNRQILASIAAHTLVIQAGINMAFSTILLPQIMVVNSRKNESDFLNSSLFDSNFTENSTEDRPELALSVTMEEASWVASLVTITTPIGSLLSGLLMEKFGRKTMCLVACLPLIVAWLLVGLTTNNVYFLYSARSLSGFGAGLSTAALVYVSEISHASLRPMLLSLNSVFVSFGILLTTLLGHIMTWRCVAFTCGLLAVVSGSVIAFLPESFLWLARQQSVPDFFRAKKSIRWFYPNLKLYHAMIQECTTSSEEILLNQTKRGLTKSRSWKPVFLLAILFFLQQFSGGYVIIFYAVHVFKEVGAIDLTAWTALIWLGVIRFMMSFATAWCSRTIGRRVLLFWSGLGMLLSMIVAGSTTMSVFNIPKTIPVFAILSFVCSSSFGYLVIPWTLIGELCPLAVRGKASGILTALAYLLMFITVRLFLFILKDIGLSNMFFVFGFFTFLAMIFVHFYIPETLGKNFEDIEKLF